MTKVWKKWIVAALLIVCTIWVAIFISGVEKHKAAQKELIGSIYHEAINISIVMGSIEYHATAQESEDLLLSDLIGDLERECAYLDAYITSMNIMDQNTARPFYRFRYYSDRIYQIFRIEDLEQRKKALAGCNDQIMAFLKAISSEGNLVYDDNNRLIENPDYTMNSQQINKVIGSIFGTSLVSDKQLDH